MNRNVNFWELLRNRKKQGLSLCVGLDSDTDKIPDCVVDETHTDGGLNGASKVAHFNRSILETTHQHVCAYKPNSAFYEAMGRWNGADCALDATIAQINAEAPDIPVILDGKRNDIGNSSRKYSIAAFDRHGADAATVNPYLGDDSLEPYLEREEKGIFILCRTSNPGAKVIQDRRQLVHRSEVGDLLGDDKEADSMAHSLDWLMPGVNTHYNPPLYQLIALLASRAWNKNGNVGLVVGATVPEQLAAVRKIVGPNMWILSPGLGAQGGDLEASIRAGGSNVIFNASRSVIFASKGKDYAKRAGEEAGKIAGQIRMLSVVSVH